MNTNGTTPEDDIENPTHHMRQPANLLALSFSEYWFKQKLNPAYNVLLDLTTAGTYTLT